jgi:hypothetical protein
VEVFIPYSSAPHLYTELMAFLPGLELLDRQT